MLAARHDDDDDDEKGRLGAALWSGTINLADVYRWNTVPSGVWFDVKVPSKLIQPLKIKQATLPPKFVHTEFFINYLEQNYFSIIITKI